MPTLRDVIEIVYSFVSSFSAASECISFLRDGYLVLTHPMDPPISSPIYISITLRFEDGAGNSLLSWPKAQIG